ncbi:MAG: hypothetical protein JWN15_1555, partial [Firmicutes bacterium]|nr:hypothetical protein [Bacillota bacterium]
KLALTGWLDLSQENRASPIAFTLRDPVAERWGIMIAQMDERLDGLEYRGEAFMQEYLSRIIASDEYAENGRPGFLINPFTDQKMEFDRYYPPHLAFEYHGPQHDGPTNKFPSTVKAQQLQARDMLKGAICAEKGIALVVLRFPDLKLSTMVKKVSSAMRKLKTPLPLRDVSRDEPVIDYLEELTETHRRAAGIIDVTARRPVTGRVTGR